MQTVPQLINFGLPIPVWHLVLYVACISFLMVQRRFKFAIVTSYVAVLYWLHYVFRADLVALIDADNVARTIYYAFGFVLVLLGVYAFFFLGDEEAEFELEKRNKEIGVLRTKAKEAKKRAAELKAELKKDQTDDSASRSELEEELAAKIATLEQQLREGEGLLEKRDADIAQFQAKTHEAEETAAALKYRLENNQTQDSASRGKLEEDLNLRIDSLELKLTDSESLVEQRDAEIAQLQAKTLEAEETAAALKSRLENDQNQDSASRRKLEEELTGKIAALETRLKESESILAIRKVKMDELKARTRDAEKHTDALNAKLERFQSDGSASANKLEEELSKTIDHLEHQLKEGENLLESRNAEIAELKSKASEGDKKANALKTQLENDHTREAAARNKLQEEFNARIAKLELRLKEGETLLQKRDAEIAELQAKTHEAEENSSALKARLENDQTQESATRNKLEEELNAKVDKLQHRLKEGETLLQKRDAEIAQLQAKTQEAEENTSVLKTKLENDQSKEAAAKNKLEEELNAKIDKLQHRLKEGETLLQKRDGEIAQLQAKTQEAEKHASVLKTKLEKDQSKEAAAKNKLEEELNAKIDKLQHRLKEGETLLQKRDAEIEVLRAKAPVVDKKPAPVKARSAANLPGAQTKAEDDKNAVEEDVRKKLHQFQYAVKYLEDQIKEKDQLLGLMAKQRVQSLGANSKDTMEEDLKKRIHQLEQSVKYFEEQTKEKDGLLGLMAKRNRELAELKSQAEEKLQMSGDQSNGDQTANGSE